MFAAWEVANVPFGDTASRSQKQAAYPNGTVLQMTGKCTGGINPLANQPGVETGADGPLPLVSDLGMIRPRTAILSLVMFTENVLLHT